VWHYLTMIRAAVPDDAAAVAAIYAPYVHDTAITFELDPPDADAMRSRIAAAPAWLVGESEGVVAGYAYAGPFAARQAYRWACEVSVYVDPGRRGAGLGTALYAALLEALTQRGLQVAVARITLPNDASLALHARFGFEPVGVHRRIGFKHGRWHDVSLHQRELARATPSPAEPEASGVRS
jgi:L-amino acid N-acyltransferase YncA